MSVCRSKLLRLPTGCPPPCPLPSCYATTSSFTPPPPPPQPDPVAPPLTRHQQALLSVSMQKTRGWGPIQHAKPDLGMSTPPRPRQTLTLTPIPSPPPRALLSALQNGRCLCKVRRSHQSTVKYCSRSTLSKVGLCLHAEDAYVQLDLRVGELMIPSNRRSSPHLYFFL